MDKSLKSEDLSKIFHQIPGVIFQCRIFQDGRFCFPFASDRIWEIYEVKPEEVYHDGSLILQRIGENDKDRFLNSIKHAAASLSQWELDYSVNLPSRGLRWLRGIAKPETQPDGSIILHGYTTDVTERKIAARALIQKEQRWHFALESSEEGIWDYHFKDAYLYLSDKLLEMLGYAGLSIDNNLDFCFDKIHPKDIARFKLDIRRHIEGKTEMLMNENRMLNSDGTYKWILHKGKIIEWTDSGSPLRMIGTHSDISEKKEKEILLNKNFKLISEQNNRLSNFAYIVSHNLRSHTSNLKILINFIENAPTQEEKEVEFEYLKTVSNQLSETIEHLNEVLSSQNSQGKDFQKLNLHHFIERTKQTLLRETEEKQGLIENNVPEHVEVSHNPAYLESILFNLISNSLKYSSGSRSPVISLNCYQEKDYLVLKIIDNGRGLNLDKYKKDLFGMYKTFHGNPDAKGIGLFITKNQVESMGGKIEAESIEGDGCTFYIHFKI